MKENSRLSSEINSLRGKIKKYENIEKELSNFHQENKILKEEINSLQSKQKKENEFNEVLKDFETNFRTKIMEVEKEKNYYKDLSKQFLSEKSELKLEKEREIFELECKITELNKKLQENQYNTVDPHFGNHKDTSEQIKQINNENQKLMMILKDKDVELSVWKEKYYELSENQGKQISSNLTQFNSTSTSDQKNEIISLKFQIKELCDKMEILNRIIEDHGYEKENLETELKIYKQKLQEMEKFKVFLLNKSFMIFICLG